MDPEKKMTMSHKTEPRKSDNVERGSSTQKCEILYSLLTWPVSSGGARSVCTCLTYRSKHSFPTSSSIAPILRFQDKCSLSTICNHEAVDHVMELTAIATAFVDITYQLLGFAAILGILSGRKTNKGKERSSSLYKWQVSKII